MEKFKAEKTKLFLLFTGNATFGWFKGANMDEAKAAHRARYVNDSFYNEDYQHLQNEGEYEGWAVIDNQTGEAHILCTNKKFDSADIIHNALYLANDAAAELEAKEIARTWNLM